MTNFFVPLVPSSLHVKRLLSDIEEGSDSELEGADPFLMAPPAVDVISYHSVVSYQVQGKKEEEIKYEKKELHKHKVSCVSCHLASVESEDRDCLYIFHNYSEFLMHLLYLYLLFIF